MAVLSWLLVSGYWLLVSNSPPTQRVLSCSYGTAAGPGGDADRRRGRAASAVWSRAGGGRAARRGGEYRPSLGSPRRGGLAGGPRFPPGPHPGRPGRLAVVRWGL